MPVELYETKKLYHEDNFARSPRLTMTYPTVDQRHFDAPALELLGQLLSDGKDSPLYKVIVEKNKLRAEYLASQLNDAIIINGDGKTSRDFCPISNVVQANILAGILSLKNNNYIFNVGTGSRISLNKLIQTIYKKLKIKKVNQRIFYRNFRKGDIRHSLSSIKNINYSLGYRPLVSFEEGIEDTIKWFKINDF